MACAVVWDVVLKWRWWLEMDDGEGENGDDDEKEELVLALLLGRVAYELRGFVFDGLVVVVAAEDEDVLRDDEEGDIIAGVYVDVVRFPP